MEKDTTFHLISLGCAKNMVDSEVLLGSLESEGFRLVEDAETARYLLVNTCGFLQSAVEEGIEEILELVRLKTEDPTKVIAVIGCMVQRYKEKLVQELPEVDLFLGTEGPHTIAGMLRKAGGGGATGQLFLPNRSLMSASTNRRLATPHFRAWLKITEGCDNHCAYCMIPSIRGGLRSRTVDDLTREAGALSAQGVREISLIAQDLTAFGRDLGKTDYLVRLLDSLLENTTIPWIRLLYLYPSGITEELLERIASEERVLPYLDMPVQHVSDSILRGMNRHYSEENLHKVMKKIREKVPGIALRTTFLVGFPGETETDIQKLEDFMKQYCFDHVGIFAYENEEGSAAEKFAHQVPETERAERRDRLMEIQAGLSATKMKKYVGTVEPVLVEGVSSETDLLLEGRLRYQAPEVDGVVYINEGTASPGDICSVEITEPHTYDLVGKIVGQ